jgi:hypothetical protein
MARMHIYSFIVGVLGVWRVTHLLSDEVGPAEILAKLRKVAGGGFWGQLFNCFYCMSVWIAAAFVPFLTQGWKQRALLWPALSGAAILLERMSTEHLPAGRGFYMEEAESEHVLR